MRRLATLLALAGVVLVVKGLWIPAKAVLAQVLLHRAWQETCQGRNQVRPWPWADTWPVARLQAPRHGVDTIVLAGGSPRTMAFAPGHVDATARPGQPGNCVLAGHRDTHFAFLEHLAPADQLQLATVDGREQTFLVTGTRVVHQSELWVMTQEGYPDQILTLVTCYPFKNSIPGGPWRYVVWAEAVPAPVRTVSDQKNTLQTEENTWHQPRNRVGYGPIYSAGFIPASPARGCVREGGRSHA
jgi:sortase A